MAYIFITKEKTNWKYLLIIFILGVIVGAGTLRLASEQVFPPPEFPETKKPEKIEDETADWKTFTNQRNGFEIKYPKDWQVESHELAESCAGCADLYEFKPSNIKIAIGGSMTWNVAKSNLEQEIDGKSEEIIVAGSSAIKREGRTTKYSTFTLEGTEIEEIILMEDYVLYHFFTTKEEKQTFDQMLSTFRFLE